LHGNIFYQPDNIKKLSKIVSIGTAVPAYCHKQSEILAFMQQVYAGSEVENRKMRFLYNQSGIAQRYSVIPDYSRPLPEWKFYPQSEALEPFPSLEQRMLVYTKQAPQLSVDAIRNCLGHNHSAKNITHLITVSCTGMSAPGLDLQVMELLDLRKDIFRTSVNFMGCYASIHAMKMADAFCAQDKNANVLIVSTELCTLHFQREHTADNIMSSLLFGDGSAAALVMHDDAALPGLFIDGFYSEIIPKGRRDMAWELSSTGFLMTLSGYVPDLIEEDFNGIVSRATANSKNKCEISHWCIHPGGKRILEAVQKATALPQQGLHHSYKVLNDYGNMSSASILFVLKQVLHEAAPVQNLFGVAFGPGLTVETFTAHT
jgi:predicted naringenin-chalcone synthase